MNKFPDLDAVSRDAEQLWAADKSLQAEFGGNKETYLAYRRADARGQVRQLVRQSTLATAPELPTSVAVSADRPLAAGITDYRRRLITARSSWLASQASRDGGISGGIF